MPRTQPNQARSARKTRGFAVLAVLFLAGILSAILWVGVSSWHQLLSQNRSMARRLQQLATSCPVEHPHK
ncbi:MAG: hypothetical protein HN742_01095 [Lentisphaerae bacterium]|jgi:type II secretory pathway component PulJ|nr:hypothetical protein [Lentisphaerota bacterium]MBT4816827.1 hypothetical protein [Lentisphaerota bacterium]MBT5606120.1 hypothetical protein [Lentisphaerota bacterium]MBT7054013.1 hypothetical protein [Lentisphaerota bacterium]MBT7840429.1 hypothetical protein [Lentisphaerota bacterium]